MVQGRAAVTVAEVLFGLDGEFRVLDADHPKPGRLRVIVEAVAVEGSCPGCGVVSSRVPGCDEIWDSMIRAINSLDPFAGGRPVGEQEQTATVLPFRRPLGGKQS